MYKRQVTSPHTHPSPAPESEQLSPHRHTSTRTQPTNAMLSWDRVIERGAVRRLKTCGTPDYSAFTFPRPGRAPLPPTAACSCQCYRVVPPAWYWLTFYLMAEQSSSLTIWCRLGQVVGSIPRSVPFFIFLLFFPKKEVPGTYENNLCVQGAKP